MRRRKNTETLESLIKGSMLLSSSLLTSPKIHGVGPLLTIVKITSLIRVLEWVDVPPTLHIRVFLVPFVCYLLGSLQTVSTGKIKHDTFL